LVFLRVQLLFPLRSPGGPCSSQPKARKIPGVGPLGGEEIPKKKKKKPPVYFLGSRANGLKTQNLGGQAK